MFFNRVFCYDWFQRLDHQFNRLKFIWIFELCYYYFNFFGLYVCHTFIHIKIIKEGLFRWYTNNVGAGRSSEVEHLLMVRWVVRSILHGVDPLSYFSFQPVLHDWCNKGRGMCYPVCGMVHIKEPLLLIGKSSLCGGSGFPLYQNGP